MFPFAATASRAPPPRPFAELASFAGAPAIREAGERVLVSLVKNLQTMAGQATVVEGTLASLAQTTVRDHLTTCRPETVAAAIACAMPACSLLAVLDGVLVHAIVELLAGGIGVEPMARTPRAATGLDGQYAHIVVATAAAAVEAEWGRHGFASAQAVRLDGSVPIDLLGGRFASVGVLTYELAIFGLRGTLTLALPAAALDSFARTAEAAGSEQAAAALPDPAWNAVLRRELGRAPVRVDALLEASDLSLGAVASLRPGQVIAVAPAARSRVALVSDGQTIFRGELGQSDDDHYSLRIDHVASDAAQAFSDLRNASDRRRSETPRVPLMEQPTGSQTPARGAAPHLDSIMRIPVSVQVLLGSASMPIAHLMKLEQGSVVTLDHSVSDPVDVVVNGRVIARGELIALDDDPSKIGVKLIEIVGNPAVSG